MGRDRELKRLAFCLYPLSFFLYSPFKNNQFVKHLLTLCQIMTFKENTGKSRPKKIITLCEYICMHSLTTVHFFTCVVVN